MSRKVWKTRLCYMLRCFSIIIKLANFRARIDLSFTEVSFKQSGLFYGNTKIEGCLLNTLGRKQLTWKVKISSIWVSSINRKPSKYQKWIFIIFNTSNGVMFKVILKKSYFNEDWIVYSCIFIKDRCWHAFSNNKSLLAIYS